MNKKLTALSVFTALLCTTILSPVSAFAQTAGSEETNIAQLKNQPARQHLLPRRHRQLQVNRLLPRKRKQKRKKA